MARPVVVPDLLRSRAEERGDALFVDIGGQQRSFVAMYERTEKLASGLASLGVVKGDRVASILPNRVEHVELIFACARLGAIHVPMNVFLKGEFLRYQLADAGASVVVGDDAGLATLGEVRADLPDLRHVLNARDMPTGEVAPQVHVDAGDAMAIVYTSGTTGMPKGCMLPYGYHVSAAGSANALLEYRPGDVLYSALPLFHGWARGMLFASLVHGLAFVLDADFSATHALRRIVETRATVFSGVGAMGLALLTQPPSGFDRAHRLRVAFMIPFAADAEGAFTDRFGVRMQSQMYGQTETGAISFTPLAENGKPGTVGRPSPQYEVRLVDEDDRDVEVGTPGEVVVQCREPDVLYTGYWDKPDETARVMRGGWHHTGDLARLDEDGYLTFVDRKKDAVRRRGENVSSVQLEAAIAAHPSVAECAVVAVPSAMSEDDIKLCVVVAPGESVTPDELFAFFSDKLPYFAIPRYVEIVDALPKTATMRVQKHILRERGITAATWDFEQLGLVVDRERRR